MDTSPLVTIAAVADPVIEGAVAAFTLTSSAATTAALTVKVAVIQEGEVLASPSNYAAAVNVTFAANAATSTLSVTTDDDAVYEELSAAPGVAGRVTATVQEVGTDYDPAPDADSATVEVQDAAHAYERLEWYARRWSIEVYHRILKSGGRVEARQLETARRLQNCLATDMIVAWRIHHLTVLGRGWPAGHGRVVARHGAFGGHRNRVRPVPLSSDLHHVCSRKPVHPLVLEHLWVKISPEGEGGGEGRIGATF